MLPSLTVLPTWRSSYPSARVVLYLLPRLFADVRGDCLRMLLLVLVLHGRVDVYYSKPQCIITLGM